MRLKTSFKTSKDLKLAVHKEIGTLHVPPTMLFSVPLAHVRNLPPVMLTVKYTGATHVDLQVDTRDAVSIETDIELGGNYSFGMSKESLKHFCRFAKITSLMNFFLLRRLGGANYYFMTLLNILY